MTATASHYSTIFSVRFLYTIPKIKKPGHVLWEQSSGKAVFTKALLIVSLGTIASCILPRGGSHHCPPQQSRESEMPYCPRVCHLGNNFKDNSGPGFWARPSHPVSVLTSLRKVPLSFTSHEAGGKWDSLHQRQPVTAIPQ